MGEHGPTVVIVQGNYLPHTLPCPRGSHPRGTPTPAPRALAGLSLTRGI